MLLNHATSCPSREGESVTYTSLDSLENSASASTFAVAFMHNFWLPLLEHTKKVNNRTTEKKMQKLAHWQFQRASDASLMHFTLLLVRPVFPSSINLESFLCDAICRLKALAHQHSRQIFSSIFSSLESYSRMSEQSTWNIYLRN